MGSGVFGQGPGVGVVTFGPGAHVFVRDTELGLAGEGGELRGEAMGQIDEFGEGDFFRFLCMGRQRQAGSGSDRGGGGEKIPAAEMAGDGFLTKGGAHEFWF